MRNITTIKSRLLETASTATEKSRLLAAFALHSGAWFNAIPIASLGLKLDNNQLHIAVATRIGAPMCHPHSCNACGQSVDERGCHGLSCRKSAGRQARHSLANDTIKRAMVSAGIPAILEPPGVSRTDGKRPDGMTLVPWQRGRALVWDFTCVDTLAISNIPQTSRIAAAAAEKAQRPKCAKYCDISPAFVFQPVAVETMGAWAADGLQFIKELGRRVAERCGEPRSASFLIQRISMAIQRGNTSSILSTFPVERPLTEVFYL